VATQKKPSPAETKRRLGNANIQRTSAREWLQRGGEDIPLPSGNVALLRRPGPEMFFAAGQVPDALAPIVESAIRDKQGLRPEKAAELANDPAMVPQVMAMADAALVAAVVEPIVRANPTCIVPIAERPGDPSQGSALCGAPSYADIHNKSSIAGFHVFAEGERIPFDDRSPEFLYCSEVDFEDKMFIFQYAVGGTRDLERFRQEYSESLDSISTQ